MRPHSESMSAYDLQKWDEAFAEGRAHANEPYCSALIPVKYERDRGLGEAWYEGFMSVKGKK